MDQLSEETEARRVRNSTGGVSAHTIYFHYLDKNSGWVTDGYGNDDFLEDY